MADGAGDGQDGGDKPKKKAGIDLAKLADQIDPAAKAARELTLDLDAISGGSAAAKAVADLQKQMQPFADMQDRMKHLSDLAGQGSAMSKLAKQITDQYKNVDAFKSLGMDDAVKRSVMPDIEYLVPKIHDLELPPNPILETNKRLERIEDRFDQMQDIAGDAAKIATGLQGVAAEFLQKFEKAASDNDRSAARAIWLAGLAVVMTIVQIGYTEFWRVPRDDGAMQQAITTMQAEITSLRDAQSEASDRLVEALATSDQETAEALREIGALLAAQPEATESVEGAPVSAGEE